MRELRDISEMPVTPEVLAACQHRISAGGQMKTAIKRYLAECDSCLHGTHTKKHRHTELRRAMEAWANLEGEE